MYNTNDNYSITLTTRQKIALQECKDRVIANFCMKEIFADYYHSTTEIYDISNVNFTDNVDLSAYVCVPEQNIKISIAIEIKERNKTNYDMERYPWSEISVKKYHNIMKFSEEYDRIFFMSLTNDSIAHLYNLSKLNVENFNTFSWNIKKTELQNKSLSSDTKMFGLYYNLASYVFDIRRYVKIYNEFYYQYFYDYVIKNIT